LGEELIAAVNAADVDDQFAQHLVAVCQNFGISFLYAHGSNFGHRRVRSDIIDADLERQTLGIRHR
jgi:hypothetical protein